MKKTILKHGLIAGLIVSAWLQVGLILGLENIDNELGMILGYTAMIVAFSFIFIAVKKYRREHNDIVTFGKALKIGLLITLVASTIYVLSWLIDYYFFVPDFMENYSAHVLEKLKADGASAAEISEKTTQMEMFSDYYKNPLMIILFTYAEILPVGIIVSFITALLLKSKSANSVEINS